jgi:hypothetical protein
MTKEAWRIANEIATQRLALAMGGYLPIPCAGKKPIGPEEGGRGWQNTKASADDVKQWRNLHPHAQNTGVLTRITPAIDIDVRDEEVATKLHAMVTRLVPGALVRYGKRPKRALLVKTNEPFQKMQTPVYESPDGQKHQVEILCDGQQIVVFGPHPETGLDYEWEGGSPARFKRDQLPELTAAAAQQLVAEAAAIMERQGWKRAGKVTVNGHAEPQAAHPEPDEATYDELYGERERKYAAAALKGCAAELEATPEGERNTALNRLAFRLGTMIARSWIERGKVVAELLRAAGACGLQEVEAQRTCKSGLGAGEQSPHPDLPARDNQTSHGEDWGRVSSEQRGSSGIAAAESVKSKANGGAGPSANCFEWQDPKDLPAGLRRVDAFEPDFLPQSLAPWVADISERLQCPPDYVAVTAIVALGSVIGRRIGIRPQHKTDWTEFPNLWGGFIGRPGMLKSPAMMAALKPLHRLEAEAAKSNEMAREAYAAALDQHKLRKQVATALVKESMRAKMKMEAEKQEEQVDFGVGEEPQEPLPIRFRTNDTSYEKLGELLIANPTGILIERDELISLLKHLDREEQCVARGFFLSGWSGNQPYTFDRIGRGHLHVDAVCISLLGNTQPARISDYVRRSNLGGTGGDGLIQRFGLFVWPDAQPDWRDVDEYPNREAADAAWKVFKHASNMKPLKLQALMDDVPYWRFDEAALDDFRGWRTDLERRLRSGSMSPAVEGHFAKYRKLIPALALINHVADVEDGGLVGQKSLLRALAFGNYLESHAYRLYGSGSEGERASATAVLGHIKAGHLQDGFTARDVHQRDWAHLTVREDVQAGLELLVDNFWIAAVPVVPGPAGGRPTVTYAINPKLKP